MHNVFYHQGVKAPFDLYQRTMLRWFNRVDAAQEMWVSRTDKCPVPPTATTQTSYNFEQWAEMAASWWFAHFEHLQKRHRPGCYGNAPRHH
jgi:hypothetical protein